MNWINKPIDFQAKRKKKKFMFFFRVLLTLTVIEKVALGSDAGLGLFSNQFGKSELIILVKYILEVILRLNDVLAQSRLRV